MHADLDRSPISTLLQLRASVPEKLNSIRSKYRRERRRYASDLAINPIRRCFIPNILPGNANRQTPARLPSSRVSIIILLLLLVLVIQYKPSHHAPVEQIEDEPTNTETKRVRFEYRHDLPKESN